MSFRFIALALCAVVLGIRAEAQQEVTVKDFKALINSSDTSVTVQLKMYVAGLGTGMAWANTALKHDKHSPLFCVPPKLPLQVENFIEIINRQMNKFATDDRLDSWPIGVILLGGPTRDFSLFDEKR